MTKKNLTQLISINKQNPINFVEKDEKILFSSLEIGKQLGYSNPYKAISNLFQRNSFELLNYSTILKVRTVDNKLRDVRHFTEEGVYILSMLANTDNARDFRKRVAELLKNLRQKEMDKAFLAGFDNGRECGLKDMELAKEVSYQQGMEYGQSLPCVQIETQKSYLRGLTEGRKIQKAEDNKKQDNWQKMEKAIDYLGKGVSLKDTARLVKLCPGTIRNRFRRLGLWEQVKNGDLWFNMPGKKQKSNCEQPQQLSLL